MDHPKARANALVVSPGFTLYDIQFPGVSSQAASQRTPGTGVHVGVGVGVGVFVAVGVVVSVGSGVADATVGEKDGVAVGAGAVFVGVSLTSATTCPSSESVARTTATSSVNATKAAASSPFSRGASRLRRLFVPPDPVSPSTCPLLILR